jgi:hypothetical protein
MGGLFGERKYTSGTPSFSELSTASEEEEKDNAEAQRARSFAESLVAAVKTTVDQSEEASRTVILRRMTLQRQKRKSRFLASLGMTVGWSCGVREKAMGGS